MPFWSANGDNLDSGLSLSVDSIMRNLGQESTPISLSLSDSESIPFLDRLPEFGFRCVIEFSMLFEVDSLLAFPNRHGAQQGGDTYMWSPT